MESLFFAVIKNIELWIRPKGLRKYILIFIIAATAILVAGLVYCTGGITFVFSHTMYIPIIVSSIVFGIKGAVVSSVLCGLLLGPYMPITVQPLVYQDTLNWIYRMLIFLVNSLLIAVFFNSAYKVFKKMEKSLFFDSSTTLPNVFSLRKYVVEKNTLKNKYHLANILIGNYSDSVSALGLDRYMTFIKTYVEHIKSKFEFINRVYILQNNNLAFIVQNEKDLNLLLSSIHDFRKKICSGGELDVYPDIYMGIIGADPESGLDLERTIEKSYYLAYQAYKNKTPFIRDNESIDVEISRNFDYITSFPDAVKNKNLTLHYQPKVLLSENRVIGAEALVRWFHPEKGMIPPMHWVPIIENTGLIDTLTEFVLEEDLKQLRKWQDEGLDIKTSINISTFNLTYEFAEHILKKLEEYGIPSWKLELEITETSLFNNLNEVIEIMKYLSEKGIEFSIDDFGTGFSSLSYLKDLPVNYLKIDQVFVRNLDSDTVSAAITRSAIDISKTLNISTVAEGIENLNSESILKKAGCNIGQGYYYSKPLPSDEFEKFVENFGK